MGGLAQGPIAAVASDHSPRPKAMKEPGWKNIFQDEKGNVIPFGSPGLETLVPLVYSEGVVKRGLPLTWMARVLGENPARMFGLHPRKGAIRVGADADLRSSDPDAEGRSTSPTTTASPAGPLRRLEDQRPPLDDAPPRPGAANQGRLRSRASASSSRGPDLCPSAGRAAVRMGLSGPSLSAFVEAVSLDRLPEEAVQAARLVLL